MITKMKRSFQSTSYPFPTVSDAALGIDKLRKYYKGSAGPFPEGVVKKVEALFPEMISSQGDTYVLHGDLHHENILLSDSGWKLIDPKGVIGELEVELIPFLSNNLPERNFELAIDNRIDTFYKELGINIARTYAWGLCYSLLSAWWNVEDNLGLSDSDLAVLNYFNSKSSEAPATIRRR